VLAAVNRVAVGEFIPELDPGSPLVAEAVKTTLAALGDKGRTLPAGSVWIDTGAFAATDGADGAVRKLGLGSSAATAACAVGAVLEMAGLPIAGHRELAYSLAESAHRTWQGGAGSGADVAAAVYGGVLQFTRPGGGTPVVRNIPGGLGTLQLVVFSSPTAVSTTSQIRSMRAFAEREPARYDGLLAPVREAAERFVQSLASQHPRETIASLRAAGMALTTLGDAAEVPIVTPPFARAAAIAAELGGGAKPSGAGGGDVGVALFPDREAALTFIQRISEERAPDGALQILDLKIDENGLSRRTAGTAIREHNV
jgi:phosphomevalonate kinase